MSQSNKPTFTVIGVKCNGSVDTLLENHSDGPKAHMLALGRAREGNGKGGRIWARVIVVSEGKVEGKYPI